MKIRKSILLGTLVIALFICAMVVVTQGPRPVESSANAPESAEEAELLPTHSATVLAAHTVPSPSGALSVAVVDLLEITPDPASVLRLSAGQALANVNGKPIQVKDLVALEAQETERMMTPEEYESRLNRAMEMELTFQAATAQGVDLTAEQVKRLDRIAQKYEATFREYQKQGITWSSFTAAQLAFEKRLTSALMLQQNLVAREAGVSPSPDAAAQARYEESLRGIMEWLKSNASIRTAKALL